MKSTAFVDKRCPVCDGKGRTRAAECRRCNGTGMIGELVDREIHEAKPTEFGKMFRKIREAAEEPLHDVAKDTGLSVSRISGIERGRGKPISVIEAGALLRWLCSKVSKEEFIKAWNLGIEAAWGWTKNE